MDSTTGILTLSQLQARELAGKRWLLNGSDLAFADYDRSQPGQPPWKTGAEGIAYPLVGTNGEPARTSSSSMRSRSRRNALLARSG